MPNGEPVVIVGSDRPFFLKPKFFIPVAAVLLLTVVGGWLIYQGKISQVTPTPTPSPQAFAPMFVCPSIKQFCQNGQDIIQNGNYLGFGAKIASGSAIYAAFDGRVTTQTRTYQEGDTITSLFLHNDETDTRAIYRFVGEGKFIDAVKAEQVIGQTGDEMDRYDGVSLLFSVIKYLDNQQAEDIKITAESFSQ